ncbi:hypothetical protein ACTJKK_02375 [Microbacterium sp. 22179]|uniref:hypothetical protein n=1 Tax=Microbacterium sp. 22179 TaxID=3453886 RepID=UPI003F859891
MSTTEPTFRLGTDLPARAHYDVVSVMKHTDEHVGAAFPAFEGLREYYLQMEERPAFNLFAVATAKQLLDWTAGAYLSENDLLFVV